MERRLKALVMPVVICVAFVLTEIALFVVLGWVVR